MVKADELIHQQKEREKVKFVTFDKIYSNIEKKILKASSTNYYYIWSEIPKFLIGYPQYNLNECCEYLIYKLSKNNFIIETYDPNILLISWFPK